MKNTTYIFKKLFAAAILITAISMFLLVAPVNHGSVSAQYGSGVYGENIYSGTGGDGGLDTGTPPGSGGITQDDQQGGLTDDTSGQSSALARTGEPINVVTITVLSVVIITAILLVVRRRSE